MAADTHKWIKEKATGEKATCAEFEFARGHSGGDT